MITEKMTFFDTEIARRGGEKNLHEAKDDETVIYQL